MARTIGIHIFKEVNPVIRFLIIADTFTNGASTLLGPIFALYIEGFIQDGNAAVAGISAAILLVSRSLFQIPIATLIDKIRGEKDDFYFLFTFTLLGSLMPLFYLVIDTSLELYILQLFMGIFSACTFPSWMAIFTRHIDSKKEGTEWGMYFTIRDLASAALAGIGGFIAISLGYQVLIVAVSVIAFAGALLLFPLRTPLSYTIYHSQKKSQKRRAQSL